MMNRADLAKQIARAVPRLHEEVVVEQEGDGLRLRGPVFKRGFFRRRMAGWMNLADRSVVELDDIGAFVVDRLDGRTMHTLADNIAQHLKLTHREAEAALTVFLQNLLRRKLITLEVREEETA
ncbi:MAG: PqqD family protein [Planctomycetota bacterium]|jgi:hypothetical protein|nr:PqqD family protein [Planctomycetota bacterium]